MTSEYEIVSWKARYIRQLIKRGWTKGEAEENWKAGISDFDYLSSPEDAADDELSYYDNN